MYFPLKSCCFRRKRSRHSAFTLVEIMIVVLIIGILLAIAVPNFLRARETSRSKACVDNLKQIDTAKEQYAMDNKLPTGTADPGMPVLTGATSYLKSTPLCPSNGNYTVNAISTSPSCSIGTNAGAPYAPHLY